MVRKLRSFTRCLALLAAALSAMSPTMTFSQATPAATGAGGQVIDVPEVMTSVPEAQSAPAADPKAQAIPGNPASPPEVRRAIPIPATRSDPEKQSPAPTPLAIPDTIATEAAELAPASSIGSAIIEIVNKMPRGGRYSVRPEAKQNLIKSVRSSEDGRLEIVAATAQPSFCSGATYLVLLQAISNLEKCGTLSLPKDLNRLLLVGSQADGVGIWGRWNSNGPGTAKLFHDLGIGSNFTDLNKARRGDFLKIWWTDQIGAREKGHSVIYLGSEKSAEGEAVVKYWSSNLPGGYGEGSAPVARIKHMLFSRLINVQAFKNIKSLPQKDPYLSSMLKVDESYQSMLKTVGAEADPR